MTCRNCGLSPTKAAGRCNACATYKSRHPDKDRPYELIRRQLEREAAARR